MFPRRYADVFKGDSQWRKITVKGGRTYAWDAKSTYVQNPPYFVGMSRNPDAAGRHRRRAHARPLLDSITTDHISPAGSIKAAHRPANISSTQGQAGGLQPYGARRGNHEVMMRGTFANIRIKNQMVPGVEGGFTIHSRRSSACRSTTPRCGTSREGPLIIFAGKEYGTGSSRDWAAKGDNLLGVRAVVCETSSASTART